MITGQQYLGVGQAKLRSKAGFISPAADLIHSGFQILHFPQMNEQFGVNMSQPIRISWEPLP